MKIQGYKHWTKEANACQSRYINFLPCICLNFGYLENRLMISWIIWGFFIQWKVKDPMISKMKIKLRKLKEEINSTDYSKDACSFKEIKKQIEATEYKLFLLQEPLKEFK